MTTVSAQSTIFSFQIVIIAILARIFLGNKITVHVGLGITFITLGIFSTIFADIGNTGSEGGTNPLLGDIFVILSCLVSAVQGIIEE